MKCGVGSRQYRAGRAHDARMWAQMVAVSRGSFPGRLAASVGVLPSAFDRTGSQAGDDALVEEDEHHQWRNGDEQDVHEQQVVLSVVLPLEVVERKLHSRCVVAG